MNIRITDNANYLFMYLEEAGIEDIGGLFNTFYIEKKKNGSNNDSIFHHFSEAIMELIHVKLIKLYRRTFGKKQYSLVKNYKDYLEFSNFQKLFIWDTQLLCWKLNIENDSKNRLAVVITAKGKSYFKSKLEKI